MKRMTHRDQVHRDTHFDPLATALLDTDAMQRLGRVYQLGYAHLVFRGGTHTRLSHVMGAAHVAGDIVSRLKENYGDAELPVGAIEPEVFLPGPKDAQLEDRWAALRFLVQWAALLHDIAHIPAGHTLEDEFEGIYEKHDDFSSPRIPVLWHETAPGKISDIRRVFQRSELVPAVFKKLNISNERIWQTVLLICLHKESRTENKTFADLIEAKKNEGFVSVLSAAYRDAIDSTFFPYMADIVGNTICADYLDYVKRDPANVGLDVVRDDRILSRFFVGRDQNACFRMALALVDRQGKPRLDTTTSVVELVRQRFRFAEIIYYHKTKVAASAMLAKVFSLLGKPSEVDQPRHLIQIDEIPTIAKELLDAPQGMDALQERCAPVSLLDPEIGDESLPLWLQMRGWRTLREASQKRDSETTQRCLRGLSLLQALVRRRLYKVCATIDQGNIRELSPGSIQDDQIESSITTILRSLRKDPENRARIEAKMTAAAGWPIDAILLYVPPRKSQAKGIETGALDRGDVVTLGHHSAVRDQVEQLNMGYKRLWRIILLVHPKYRRDTIGLSHALESFICELWPQPCDERRREVAAKECAWFPYVPRQQREAARVYSDLVAPATPNWVSFEKAWGTTTGTIDTQEHADRAYLLAVSDDEAATEKSLLSTFGAPGALSRRLEEVHKHLTVEGREGVTPIEKHRAALDHILQELNPKSASSKRRRSKKGDKDETGGLPFES